MYTLRTLPETDLAFLTFVQSSKMLKMCFFSKNGPETRLNISYDSLTMLTTLLDPFGFCDDNQWEKIIHGPLSGHQKVSFFTKNDILCRKSLFSDLWICTKYV